MNDLIDTTEMYLKTIYELEEEGVVPLRARIAERLGQSGPTVSQTVARLERDGLLVVGGDRQLELTAAGRGLAVAVMRKHRLAERLLVDIIGLEWEHAHTEACRWEHVMSEAVERKLVGLLGNPATSPYGNPIPGLQLLVDNTVSDLPTAPPDRVVSAVQVAQSGGGQVLVRWIAEHVQLDPVTLSELKAVGIVPGETITIDSVADTEDIRLQGHYGAITIASSIASAVLTQPR